MSVRFEVGDVLRWTGGRQAAGAADARFSGVDIDTRRIGPDQLFVAIRGERHDAHAFLAAAIEAGCGGLLVESTDGLPPDTKPELPVIQVDDTTRALGALAAGHRRRFDGPVVAITGSNGKTTAKELCAAILAQAGSCHKNTGNLNNQFGLPLTLLSRPAEARFLVVEIGMNHRGEIASLTQIARPTVGLITTVGTAHIEHLGSQEAIAEEKGDLVAGLPATGTAVLNADDPRVAAQAARSPARVRLYGRGAGAEIRALDVRFAAGRYAFRLEAAEGSCPVSVAGLADHVVSNALGAAAAALAAGADLDAVRSGLDAYRPVAGRMAPLPLPGGGTLIDDSYNANPQSMEASLRALASLRGAGPAIAVVGDMGELGASAEEAHRATGALAAELALDHFFTLGSHAPVTAQGARGAGMPDDRVHVAESHDEIAHDVRALLREGAWVLVKGSRAMQMERVVAALRGSEE